MNEISTQVPRGRGRPAGAVNKKYGVKLKDLCSALNPEFVVPVSKELATLLKMSNASIIITETDRPTEMPANAIGLSKVEAKIDFSVTEPE